jgi:hypothetical protein
MSNYLLRTIGSDLSGNKVLNYFNQMLFGLPVDGVQFSPDINGYTLIFLLPPYLSGYNLKADMSSSIGKILKKVCFLAMDFTPPSIQVTASEVMTKSGSIPYAVEVISSGQMSISFLDNDKLELFGFHKSWVSYIEDVTRGVISPSSEFLENGEIDYASSAYIIKFKPTKSLTWGDIIYVGKATGIFPLNIPDKEVLGRRDSHELTMLPINYTCTLYRQQVFGSPAEPSGWIYDEVKSLCLDSYS